MKQIILYIDTSAFKALGFNLSNPSMQLIKSGVDDTLIIVLTNMILESEIASHCGKAIEEDKAKISKLGALDYLFSVNLDKIRSTVEDGNVDLFQKTFRYDFSPKNIDPDIIDWKGIFIKYFNQVPPFNSKKKSEFPDAFVIEMLRPYLNQNLHIVSGDNDFHSWAEQEDSVTPHRSIKAFADFFTKSIVPHERFIEIYKSKKNDVAGRIKKHIKRIYTMSPHLLSEGYSEVVSAYVSRVDISSMSIFSLNQEENAIDIKYCANGIVSVEIEDNEAGLPLRYSTQMKILFSGKVKLVFDYSTSKISCSFFEDCNWRLGPSDNMESEAVIQANEDVIYRNFPQDEDIPSNQDQASPIIPKRRAPRGQKFLWTDITDTQ